jgi:hypothetical protein
MAKSLGDKKHMIGAVSLPDSRIKKYMVEEGSINSTAAWSDSIAAIAVYFNAFPVIDLTLFALLVKGNVLLFHADFPHAIAVLRRFFLVGQERMVYRKSEDGLDLIKRELERFASIGLKVLP